MKNLNILFPTDFSGLSQETLKTIIPVVKQGKNNLIILHAASRKKNYSTADRIRINEEMDHFLESVPSIISVNYETRWEYGTSRDLILCESDKVEIDLIIMATKGATGLNTIWGSKTEAVVRDAIVPVIVMPLGAKLDHIKSIALAADYESLQYDHALDALLQIADSETSSIDVVTVNRSEDQLSRKEKINRKYLKRRLQHFPHRFKHHFEDEVSNGLIQYAKTHQSDLIAILPRDYRFLEGLFTERLSKRMVYKSEVPLLILK
jgi:nucleotide-binding universal stress UspA family protein